MMSVAALVGVTVVAGLRPPAVPLMVQDPYISFWSPVDKLNEGYPMRWSGQGIGWSGVFNVDGQCYRWLGPASGSCATAANQTALVVDATKTTYTFSAGGVELDVSFRTPSVMDPKPDFATLSLPLTYVTYSIAAVDGGTHAVSVYFDSTAEPAVNSTDVVGSWERSNTTTLSIMKIGSPGVFDNQNGDNISWGKFIIAFLNGGQSSLGANAMDARIAFNTNEKLPADNYTFRSVDQGYPVAAYATPVSQVGATPVVTTFLIGFDEGDAAIRYFGTNFPPLWRHLFATIESAASTAMTGIATITKKCDDFDAQLKANMTAKGQTPLYGEMGALAYRQVTGGMKLVYNNIKGQYWTFLKEISSDGDVSTVDVIYPASPAILYYSPQLYQTLLLPLLAYANNETAPYGAPVNYNLAWAPHHLGRWPVCNLAPNHQEQMPVEETANLLLNIRYITRAEQSTTWLQPYWRLLDIWSNYLISALPDPGNQLCTDDFEGPSPHNSNLAVKGIVALGAYSQLMTQIGNYAAGNAYMSIAKNFADAWVINSTDASGTHTKLQYNLTGTWSQKYNLVWQPILGLDLVPSSVIEMDMKYYRTKMQTFGLPLDSRSLFTKTDWSMWTAAMAPQDQFIEITNAVYAWTNVTTSRVPWSDWYWTDKPTAKGFKARPVIGGIFVKMLMP